ncbi:MAG: septum formation inhibitor Maf [Gammaproteobacteria bacterium]|nr:septum formation inhibitor Maf [Gammaproteobacteria bacterium]NIR83680.1 septum formation inhibitor Maf [Gammaproteobacteria bacterium]NIR91655.1 septum formation inhibitor Maf [Gammaproteobacteria bacterium]NIU04842.1 septum formation inhibitor Maf [Gammaproteobacteria bacterium]NIV51828.1 septum formation inhibitor Maf [Gammaproteobacteria bacterium]
MIYLASRSPRRRALLDQIGVQYRPLPVDLDEQFEGNESAAAFVQRMARLKAETGRSRLPGGDPTPVLGADTAVVVDGEVLGKPASVDEARRMVERLSGRAHEVLTAVALASKTTAVSLSRSRVWFRELDPAERDAYCASGEPLDKAGGYAIQGLAAVFVRRLEGSYSGVMGLPLLETAELLRAAGIDVLSR